MADDTRDVKPEMVNEVLGGMNLEEGASADELHDTIAIRGSYSQAPTPDPIKRSRSATPAFPKSESHTPIKVQSESQTPKSEFDGEEETIGGDITVTVEPGKGPKLLRKSSQKVVSRPAPLFSDLEDVTGEAIEVFQVIKDCIYGSKYMGSSEHDALDCDCSEEWGEYFQRS
jgi:histone-lysine N-methyltransferase SETD2